MKREYLEKLRTEKNMKLENISEFLEIKTYYWLLENGKRKMLYEMAVKIAKVFGEIPDGIFKNQNLTTS